MIFPGYIDILEMLILACTIYCIVHWLAQDEKKRLLYIFYGYCFSIFLSFIGHLVIIYTLLLFTSPIWILIGILLHQKILQKNFISLIKKSPKIVNSSWLNEFMKCILIALNRNKETTYVIECFDDINLFIKAPSKFNADITADIFSLLLENHTSSTNYLVWLDVTGKLIATNANWILSRNSDWLTSEMKVLQQWKRDGIIITNQCDAIIFKSNPTTRMFDIIIKGKLFENLNTNQLYNLLNLHMNKKTNNITKHFNINSKAQQTLQNS